MASTHGNLQGVDSYYRSTWPSGYNNWHNHMHATSNPGSDYTRYAENEFWLFIDPNGEGTNGEELHPIYRHYHTVLQNHILTTSSAPPDGQSPSQWGFATLLGYAFKNQLDPNGNQTNRSNLYRHIKQYRTNGTYGHAEISTSTTTTTNGVIKRIKLKQTNTTNLSGGVMDCNTLNTSIFCQVTNGHDTNTCSNSSGCYDPSDGSFRNFSWSSISGSGSGLVTHMKIEPVDGAGGNPNNMRVIYPGRWYNQGGGDWGEGGVYVSGGSGYAVGNTISPNTGCTCFGTSSGSLFEVTEIGSKSYTTTTTDSYQRDDHRAAMSATLGDGWQLEGTLAFSPSRRSGCTDSSATNYDAYATETNNGCTYETTTVTSNKTSLNESSSVTFTTTYQNYTAQTLYWSLEQVYPPANGLLQNDNKVYKTVQWYDNDGTLRNFIRVRIKVPNGSNTLSRLPVVVAIHGGGWYAGSRITFEGDKENLFCNDPNLSSILVTIDYRLTRSGSDGTMSTDQNNWDANRFKYPIPEIDCARAVKWVYDNIASYGGNKDNITILGHAAGAHLAAMVASNALIKNDSGNTYVGNAMSAEGFPSTGEGLLDHFDIPVTSIKRCILLDTTSYDLFQRVGDVAGGDVESDEAGLYVKNHVGIPYENTSLGVLDFSSQDEYEQIYRDASPSYQVANRQDICKSWLLVTRGSSNRSTLTSDFATNINQQPANENVQVKISNYGSGYTHATLQTSIGNGNANFSPVAGFETTNINDLISNYIRGLYDVSPFSGTFQTDLNPLSGSFYTNLSSGNSVTVSTLQDLVTEGPEYFKFVVRKSSQTGTVAAESGTITITDSSLTVNTNPVNMTSFVTSTSIAQIDETYTLTFAYTGTPTYGVIQTTDVFGNVTYRDVISNQSSVDSGSIVYSSPVSYTMDGTSEYHNNDVIHRLYLANAIGGEQSTLTVTLLMVPPVITSFSVDDITLTPGQSHTLSWNVSNTVDSLDLVITDKNGTESTLSITTPTTGDFNSGTLTRTFPTSYQHGDTLKYKLVATNATDSDESDEISLICVEVPSITGYGVDDSVTIVGQVFTISWTNGRGVPDTMTMTDGTKTITLTNDATNYQDFFLVTDANGTQRTFTLTATNSSGTASASIVITKTQETTATFSASPDELEADGDIATLTWTTSGTYSGISITGTDGTSVNSPSANDTATFNPTVTTTYIFELTGPDIIGGTLILADTVKTPQDVSEPDPAISCPDVTDPYNPDNTCVLDTFTAPGYLETLTFTCIGGGGAGQDGPSSQSNYGGGGAGGAFAQTIINLPTAGTVYEYFVGEGGDLPGKIGQPSWVREVGNSNYVAMARPGGGGTGSATANNITGSIGDTTVDGARGARWDEGLYGVPGAQRGSGGRAGNPLQMAPSFRPGGSFGGYGTNADGSPNFELGSLYGIDGGAQGAQYGGGGRGSQGTGSTNVWGGGGNGTVAITYSYLPVSIDYFVASPSPQDSGIDGIPNYDVTLSFDYQNTETAIITSTNGDNVDVTGLTSYEFTNLPQSSAGVDTIVTYTLTVSNPGDSTSSVLNLTVRNDDTSDANFLTYYGNKEPSSTTTELMGTLSSVDMIVKAQALDPDGSLASTAFFSNAINGTFSNPRTFNPNEPIYLKATALGFSTIRVDEAGNELTGQFGRVNPRNITVVIGSRTLDVNWETRAPIIRENFDMSRSSVAFGDQDYPSPDIDFAPNTIVEFQVSTQETIGEIEIPMWIRTSDENTEVNINSQGWQDAGEIN